MEKSEGNASSSKKTASNLFTRALKGLLRLLVSIVLGLSIGLGLYFGGKTLYQLAVGPDQSYDQHLQAIQEEVAQLRLDFDERDSKINEQQSELEHLVNDGSDQSEVINEQVTVLAAELAALTGRVDTLEMMLSEAGNPVDEMRGQLQLIRAMTLLSRAQFWLSDVNLGQAGEDVESARAMIEAQAEELRGDAENEDKVSVLDEIVDRLTIALEDIRTQPSIAEGEIGIAWKLLIVVTDPENLSAD